MVSRLPQSSLGTVHISIEIQNSLPEEIPSEILLAYSASCKYISNGDDDGDDEDDEDDDDEIEEGK